MTIAPATWRDVMALWRLERACFLQDAYDPLTLLVLVVWPGDVALKAATDNEMVGFVAGGQPWGERFAWIVTLAVSPQARRRGIGARLLAECEARLCARPLRGVSCGKPPTLRLMVRESNASAIALYDKSGYVRVRREAGYYGDGEAGLLMEKRR